MAEYLSPGVFVEEVPAATQVVQAVSTSNMGIVGFTPRGPVDEASLVTSYEQYTKTFGDLTAASLTGHSVLAFFANGGRRCFVTRVMPSDASAADGDIQCKEYSQQIEQGDGATPAFSKIASTTTLEHTIVAKNSTQSATFGLRWRVAGTPVVGERLKARDGTTNITLVNATATYEFRISTAGTIAGALAEGDLKQCVVVPAALTIKWDPAGTGPVSQAIPAPTSGFISTVTSAQGSVFIFDHSLGIGSVLFAGTDVPAAGVVATSFVADYTPASTSKLVADDGAGNLVAVTATTLAVGVHTLNYNTAAYSFTAHASAIPHNKAPILATYYWQAWALDPISSGVWANGIKIRVSGNIDSFDTDTQAYSLHDVSVLEYNSSTGTYDVKEAYEAVDFTDSTSNQYFPDVINELSDLVTVTTPGGDSAPGSLDGLSVSVTLGGGDASSVGQTFGGATGAVLRPDLAGFSIGRRTISITYTDSALGTTKTITDDGTGNLIGNVDPAYATTITVSGTDIGPNEVNYDLGVANFKTATTIKASTLVRASYYTDGEETQREELFGDSTKRFTDSLAVVHYAAGADGTFTTGTYSRAQFTNPTLQASYRGLYAFDRVDEILQVIIPDFAGDTVVTGDLLDYAAYRALQPHGGDRFIILTVPQGSSAQEAVDWVRYDFGRYSKWCALYWPWVKIQDPITQRSLTMPPLGHVAGVYARTDSTKNVGKAPAGTVDGALQFITGLEMVPSQGERDYVYPYKVNPLVSSPQTGMCVWGVRTLSQESEWRYINARRLFMFAEKSIFNSTAWICFENNGSGLWARISGQLNGFLQNMYMQGMLKGNSPSEAYFIKVDTTNNTAATIDAGIVVIDVGLAYNRPAEFVVLRFQQQTLAQ